MNVRNILIALTAIFGFSLILVGSTAYVSSIEAQSDANASCVNGTADECNRNPDCGRGKEIYPSLACQSKKLIDPDADCYLYYCDENNPPDVDVDEVINVNIFGVVIRANSSMFLQTMLFVAFNVFLAVAGLFLAFIGIWAAYQRAQAESSDDVESATKTIRNALVGIALVVFSIVIAQLLASYLGIGSLNSLVDFSQIGESTIPYDELER